MEKTRDSSNLNSSPFVIISRINPRSRIYQDNYLSMIRTDIILENINFVIFHELNNRFSDEGITVLII